MSDATESATAARAGVDANASGAPARTLLAGEFTTRWRVACAYALLTAVLILIVALPILSFWHGEPISVETIGPLNLFAGQIVLAMFLVLWFVLQQRADGGAFLHLPRGGAAGRLVTGVRIGVLGWLATMAAMIVLSVAAQSLGATPRHGFTDVMVWMAERPLWLRAAVIATAMTVEEAFFRAFLQSRLGLLGATVCFALSHVNYGSPAMSGGVFVIGWILGRTFEATDDLAICAVAHGTFDAIQLLIVLPLIAAYL